MMLRDLSVDDLPVIAAIDARCFGDGAWSAEQLRGSLSLPTTRGLALCQEDRIVAFSLAQILQGEIEILTIGVDPPFQRQGFGEKLIKEILSLQHGAAVFLEVAEDNLPAIRLYEKCGFVLFGRRPGYYQCCGGPADALTYRYLVNDNPS